MSNKETLNQRDHEAAPPPPPVKEARNEKEAAPPPPPVKEARNENEAAPPPVKEARNEKEAAPPPVKEARNEKDAPSKNRDNSDGLSFEPGWLNNKRSLGSSVDHSTRFTPSKYKYSKEELLSLWKPQGPLPPDSAPYPIVTTEECLTPVNLLPSEQQDEKATAYRRTSLGRGRGSGRGRGNRPLWADDDQSDSFVLGEKTLDRPLRRSTVDDDDELLFEEGNDRTPGKHRSPVHSPQDTGSESEQPPQKDSRGGVGGIEGSYTWQYRDPQGNVQGPFSALEMGGWYDAGYFGPELMVKRQDYPNFVYLRNLLRKDGESPFAEPKTSGGKVAVLDEQLLSKSDDEEHIQLQKASDKVSELDIKVHAKSISSKSAPTPVPASTPPASIATPTPAVAPAQTPIPTPISAPTVPRPSAAAHSQLSSMKSTTATPVASTVAQPKAQPKATSIPATTPAAVPVSIPATVPISTPATLPTAVSASTAALVHNLIETGDEGKALPRRSSIEPISAARSTLTTSGSAILAASPVVPIPEEALFVERFGIVPKPQQVLQGNPFQQPPQFQQMGHPPHPLQQLHPQGAFPPMSPLRRSDGMSQRAGVPPSGIPPSGLPPAGLPPFPTAAFSHEIALMYAGWQGPGHAPPHLSHDSAHQQAMHQAIHKQPAKNPQVGMLPQPPYHDQFLPPHPFLDPQQQFILQQQILQQQLLQQERNFLQQQAQTQAEVVSHEPLRRKSGVFLLDESGMAVQIATPTGAQKDQPAAPPSSGNPPPSDSNSTPSPVPIKEGSAWGQKPDAQARRMSLREIQEEELRQQSLARNTDPKEVVAQSLSKSQGNAPAPSAEGFFWDLPAVVPTTPLKSSGSIPTPTPTITPALSQPSDRRQSAPSVSFPQAELPRPVAAPLNDQPSNMVAETKESRKKKDKVAPTQQAQSQPQVSTPPPQKPLSKSQTQIQVPPQQQPQPQPEGWGITSQPKRYPSLQDIQAEELQQQQQQQFASPTADLRKSVEVKRPQQLPPVQQPERKVVSLREIQEEEMRQAQRRKEAEELQRQEALKQQAALLAQQQAAIRWGPSQPIVPDVAKPLSLSQIQEEEQRKRELERKRKADLKKKEEEEGRSRPTFPSDGLWAAAAAGNQSAPLSVVMKEQMEQKKDATSKKEQQQAAAKKSDRKAPESAWNTEKSAPRLASESEKPKPQPPQAAKQAASKTAAAPAKKVPAKQAKSQKEDIFFWDPVSTPEKPVQSQESPTTSEKPKTAQSKSAKNSM